MAEPTTIDLTVLVYGNHCQTARAYLVYLRTAGLRPRKVLHVVAPGARREARLLSRMIGRRATARLVEWAVMRRYRSAAMRRLCDEVQAEFAVKVDYFGPMDYAAFAAEYERVVVADLNAPAMLAAIRRQPYKSFLYTCGGRVGGELLGHDGVRLLHIHPGAVPHVKGSDGLLWSMATRGRPGASCFYMNEGIDSGEIIRTREFSLPQLSEAARNAPPAALERALLLAYDPHLRARLLVEVLSDAGPEADLAHLPTTPQAEGEGRTFFYMHPRLREQLIARLQQAAPVAREPR